MKPSIQEPNPTGSSFSNPLPMIFHVDMDAFFAAVEVRSDPRLRGQNLVVGGGPGPRGVVTAASYPARRFGIKAGMAMGEALKRCPDLVFLPVDPSKMIFESLQVLEVLDRFTRRLEPASIDEAYLWFSSESSSLWVEKAKALASNIQTTMLMERGLTCSIGVGINKLQAKMASALQKPRGISVIHPNKYLEVFGHRPVGIVPGIGPKTQEVLRSQGVLTVEDLTQLKGASHFTEASEKQLVSFGLGLDERSVVPDSDPKSAGHETTFARDVADPRLLKATLSLLADRVARRLRVGRRQAKTVEVRYKIGKQRFSRQRTLIHFTNQSRDLLRVAWDLLEPARKGKPLRLLGVAGSCLHSDTGQSSLVPVDNQLDDVTGIGDRLRDRFGEQTLLPATIYRRSKPKSRNPIGFQPVRRNHENQ